ncbi:MAG: SRPBCC domain-containing protein [Chitinophagaceae bacterium]|nr:MAG: SRPBCC domain-containing protein [Chitinophagaceae bacterium]
MFTRIVPHHILEFTNSFADENGNVIAAPFDISLPKKIFYSLYFEDKDNITVLTLTGSPVDAAAEEIEAFSAIHESMQEGFGATFDQLDVYIQRIGENQAHS